MIDHAERLAAYADEEAVFARHGVEVQDPVTWPFAQLRWKAKYSTFNPFLTISWRATVAVLPGSPATGLRRFQATANDHSAGPRPK